MPRVTVVIPCYKQAQYLPEAVESVVAQRYTDWELHIVNDDSPDNTIEVATQLIEAHPHHAIRLISQPNGGCGAACNAGIAAGSGEYILRLDADDVLWPLMLAHTVPVLDTHPDVGFVYSHTEVFGDQTALWYVPPFSALTILEYNTIPTCAVIRRSTWAQNGGYGPHLYEDWDFWVGCIEHGWSGHLVREVLWRYRKHGYSMINDANAKHDELMARLVLRHRSLYSAERIRQAEDTLERLPLRP